MPSTQALAIELNCDLGVLAVEVPDLGFAIDVPVYRCSVGRVREPMRANTYNKRANAELDDGQSYPTFAELIVIDRLRRHGWTAGWANRSRPQNLIVEWPWDYARASVRIRTPPPEVFKLVTRIDAQAAKLLAALPPAPRARASGGGLFDVIAWRDGETSFIECKHCGEWNDQLRPSQKLWVAAAIELDVPADDLGVFEWNWQA